MSKSTKSWLWVALVLAVATTALNAGNGRWISVVIAIGALVGLCALLFKEKKWGYVFMCVCYALSFINGVYQGLTGESGVLAAVLMSFIGSALIPCVTALFLRKDWKKLK